MGIKKTSRIQYSINTTLPYLLPTLNYVSLNNKKSLKKADVRNYMVKNHSQGRAPRSEKDITSKIIDRYLKEDKNKNIKLGDLGTALLKTWEKYPQTRNELLLIGYSKHFIVEFTIMQVSNFLNKGFKEVSIESIQNKVKNLDFYPDLAKKIEKNVGEILKDLTELNILPERKTKSIYNIEYYKPTDLGLLYYLLFYFPELRSLSLNALHQSKLLNSLITDINSLKNAFQILNDKNLVSFESFADVQKYYINIESVRELNEKL